jgi:hypothetical protein
MDFTIDNRRVIAFIGRRVTLLTCLESENLDSMEL